jgi:hypothetical protein
MMEGDQECFANILHLLHFSSTKTSRSLRTCHRREYFSKTTKEKADIPPLSLVAEPGEINSENKERLYDLSMWFFFATKTEAAR